MRLCCYVVNKDLFISKVEARPFSILRNLLMFPFVEKSIQSIETNFLLLVRKYNLLLRKYVYTIDLTLVLHFTAQMLRDYPFLQFLKIEVNIAHINAFRNETINILFTMKVKHDSSIYG